MIITKTGGTAGIHENEDYIDYSEIKLSEDDPSIFDALQEESTASAHGLEYKPNIDKKPFYVVDKVTRQAHQEDPYQPLSRSTKLLLNDIFDKITVANDQELGLSERSNNFDEWRDMLQVLSRKGEDLTNNHRKILGALISSAGEQDISDFNVQELKLFLEASNLLRQPRLSKQDSKRIVKNIIDFGLKPIIHLNPDDINEEEMQEVDEMMKTLLEKSRSQYGG